MTVVPFVHPMVKSASISIDVPQNVRKDSIKFALNQYAKRDALFIFIPGETHVFPLSKSVDNNEIRWSRNQNTMTLSLPEKVMKKVNETSAQKTEPKTSA